MFMLTSIVVIAIILFLLIVMAKYKFAYVTNISGIDLGYINNIDEFEKQIEKEISNPKEANIAFVDVKEMPKYSLTLINKSVETNENDILNEIMNQSIKTYKFYAIILDEEQRAIVESYEEAEKLVAEIKEEYSDSIKDLNIGIKELYTKDMEEFETVTVANAKEELQAELDEISKNSINGVYLACVPTSGVITSRFGAVESVRSGAHSGLDIGAPTGTPIYTVADGTVTFSGVYGGYGNLVIISHGNGVETYYGHCSALYVSEGQYVSAGENIAAVGSTGNSTGPHLHFEIRSNGQLLNPEEYIYGN